MATRPGPDTGHPLRTAADHLADACAGAKTILFDHREPGDALAAGVDAIGRIYDLAAPRRRRPKH